MLNDAQAFAHTSPVYVDVGGRRTAVAADAKFYIEWIEKLIARTNERGRFATPEDVARAILFLADPAQSGFVNGHTLVVDGGWTADGSWESLRLSHRGARNLR